MPDQTVARYEVHFSADTSEIDKSVQHVAQVLNQATTSAASSGKGLGAALSNIFAGVSQGLRAGVAEAQAYAKANDINIGTAGQLKLALAGLAAGVAATVAAHMAAKHASEQHAAALGKLAEGHGGLMARLEGLSRGLEGVGRSAEQSGQSMGFWATTLASGFGMQIDRAIQSVKALGQEALGTVVEFEKTQATMASLIGKEWVDAGKFENMQAAMGDAKEAAKELLAWTQKLAIESPFEEKDVSATLRIAQAYGFAATQFRTVQEAQKAGVVTAQRLTEATLNWAAATGRGGDAMQTVAFVSGQISKSGRLLGQDMMQLANVGLSIESAIAKSMGKSTAEIAQMREKGLIPSTVAMKALIEELETYGASAKEQSNSLGGLLASLTDLQKIAARSVAAPFFDNFREGLANLITVLQSDDFVTALGNIGQKAGETFKGAAVGLAVFGDALKGTVVSLGQGDIGGVFDALLGSLTKNVPVIEQAFQRVEESLAGLSKTASEHGPDIGGILTDSLGNLDEVLVSGLDSAEARVAEFGTKVHDDLAGAVDPAWAGPIQVGAQILAEAFTYAKTIVEGFIEGLKVGQERFGPLLAGLGGLGEEAKHLVDALMPTRETLVQVGTAAGTLAALLYGVLAGAIQLVGKYWETLVIHFGTGAVIGAVVAILTTLAATLASLLGPMELLGAAVALFVEAWINDWGGIRDITLVVVGVIASVLALLGEIVAAAIPYVVTLAQFVGGVLVAALQMAGQAVLWIVEHFKVLVTIVGAIVAAVGGVGLIGVLATLFSVFQGLIGVIASAGGILGAISTVFGIVAAAINLPIIAIGVLIAAVVGLVLAWQQNLGNIQERTQAVFGGINNWLALLGNNMGAFVNAIATAFTKGPAAAFEQFQANVEANKNAYNMSMEELAQQTQDAMARSGQSVQGFAAENDQAQSGIQGAAQRTGEIMKAVMSGDLETAKQLASQSMSGIAGVFGEKFAGIRADAWNTAAQVQAAMALAQSAKSAAAFHARSGDVTDEINQQTLQWQDAQQAARKSEEAAKKAGQYFGGTGGAFNQGIQDATRAAKGGGGAGGKKAAETVEEQIKEAAEVIRSVTDTVLKLKDFLASGPLASLRSDAKSEEIIQVATWIIDLGKRMSAVFLEAAKGFKEEGNKAAAALAEAISTTTKAVGDVAGLLVKLGDLMKHDKWPDMHANMDVVLGIAQELLAFGMALAAVLVPAAEGMKEEAAKSAGYLAQAIQSSAQAVAAVVELLPKLWAFVESPDFDDIMAARDKLKSVAKKLISWGKSVAKEFVKAARGVSEQQAKAAQNLASVIGSATGSVSQILELIPKLLLFKSDPGFMAALENPAERAGLLKVAKALIKFGAEVGKLFAASGKGLKEKVVVQAKRLADIIGSTSQGLAATDAALRLLISIAGQRDLMAVLESKAAQEPLRAVTRYLARLARIISEDWAAEGRKLSSVAVAAAQRLTEGVKATSEGLSAAYAALLLLASQAPTIQRVVSEGERYLTWLIALSGWLARLSLYVIREWGRMGSELSNVTVVAAQRLTEGVKATSEGLSAAYAALLLLASQAPTIQRVVSEGEAYSGWLVALAGWLARLAAHLANEWGRVAVLLNQTTTGQGQALTAAIKDTADGLSAAFGAILLLARQAPTIQRIASQGEPYLNWLMALTTWLAHLASWLSNEWGRVAVLLNQTTTAQGQALTAAIKDTADGLSAAFGAVLFLVNQAPTIQRIANQGQPLIDYLVALTTWLAHLAAFISNEWGHVASLLNQVATGPIDDLTKAIQSTADGLGGTVNAIELLLEQRARVDALARQGQPLIDYLVALTSWLAHMAAFIANEWGRVAVLLNQTTTAQGAALADAIRSTADGMAAVVSAIDTLLQWRRRIDDLGRQGQPLVDYLVALTTWLAHMASWLSNEWNHVATLLDQSLATSGANLASAIKSVSDGLTGVVAAIETLLQWRRWVDDLARQGQVLVASLLAMTTWLAGMAVLLSNAWGKAASALDLLAPNGEALTTAVKAVTEGLTATVEAVQYLIDLGKRGFPTIDPQGAYELIILPLITMAKLLADKMAQAVGTWVPLPAATQALRDALVNGLDALTATVQIVQLLADLSKRGFPTIDPQGAYDLVILPLITMGKSLADLISQAVGAWAPIPSALNDLAPILKAGVDTLETVKKAADYLTEKPTLPVLTDALKQWLTDAVKWAGDVATACQAGAAQFIKLQVDSLGDLAKVIGDSLSVLDSVRDAVKYLAEKPDLPPLTDALKLWLTDAVKWARDVATVCQTAAVEFVKLQVYGLGDLATVMGDALSVLDSVRDAAKYLAELPSLPDLGNAASGESLLQWLKRAVEWAIDVATEAAAAASEFAKAKDYGLGDLSEVMGDTMGVLDSVREASKYLAEPPTLPDLGDAADPRSLLAWVTRAVEWAESLATAAIAGAKSFALAKDYGLGDLATAIGDALGVLDSVREAAKYLAEPPDLPTLTDAVLQWIWDAVDWGRSVADEAIDAAKTFALAKDYGLGDLATAMGDAMGVLDSVRDAAKYLAEKPDLPPITWALLIWVWDAVKWAVVVGETAANAAREFAKAKEYGLGDLATVMGDALDVLDSVKDAAKYLAEKPDLPPITWTLLLWIWDAVKWAVVVGETAANAAREFAKAKDYGLGDLATVMGDLTGLLKDLRDAADYLGKRSDLPELTPDLLDWLEDAVRWAKTVSEHALDVAAGFKLAKDSGLADLASAIGDTLSVIKDTLDLAALRSKIATYHTLDTSALDTQLDRIVDDAKAVALRLLARVQSAGIGEAWAKAAGDFASVVGDAVGTVKDVLDLTEALFNPDGVYIPSPGQLEARLDAVLALVVLVAQRFAGKVKALPQEVKDQAKEAGEAFGQVFDGLKSMVELVQAFTGIYLGMSGFNNIKESLRILFDIFDWATTRAANLEPTVALISTLVNALEGLLGFDQAAGGSSLTTLSSQSGAASGTAWVNGFVANIAAGSTFVKQALALLGADWASAMMGAGGPGQAAGPGNLAGASWVSGFTSGLASRAKDIIALIGFLAADWVTAMHGGGEEYNYGDKAGAAWAVGFGAGLAASTTEIVVTLLTIMSSLTATAGVAGSDAGMAWVTAFKAALAAGQIALPGVSVPGQIGASAATGSGAQAQTTIIQARNQRTTNISMTNQNADAARQSMANLYAIVNF